MKHRLLRTLSLFLLLLAAHLPLSAATTVTIDGLNYNLDETALTAEVGDNKSFVGDCVIPASISYSGKTYRVATIGGSAFRSCTGLTSVTIPNSVTTIGYDAFYGCMGLTSVTIGNSVTTIGGSAFRSCTGLTSVTIPNSVTTIGGSAFSSCTGLTSVTIGNSVTTIGNEAFSGCSGLTSVMIGNSVTTINKYAFSGCRGLTSVTIPNSVTTIGDYAFFYCSGLTSVTIGNSVTSISSYAFLFCTNLCSVTSLNVVPPAINSSTFTSMQYQNAILHVPAEGFSAYKEAAGWKNFLQIDGISGVDEAIADTLRVVGYYNMQGVRSGEPWPGLNIVIYSDGTTRKTLHR